MIEYKRFSNISKSYSLGQPDKKYVHRFFWNPPDHQTVKVNIDGSFNKSSAGVGGVYKNHLGQCLFYFHIPIEATDAVETELMVVYWALKIAKMASRTKLWVEVDSTAVIKILRDDDLIPWHLIYWTKKIREISSLINVQYTFIFRDGNQPANWLAIQGYNLQELSVVVSPLRTLQFLLQGDRLKVPYFRIAN
ncbi:uncharacterized protein LOC110038309 [Phalaenopsis equestris]|uniref:uncharacterized protein LOC110038309 n=1 Tax=Phalaenopsis equestris TaxID=78828 RepID=UPI0009E3954F|nr:uncharacterized protein LOC110038309 [Phalaenopsis equestris]